MASANATTRYPRPSKPKIPLLRRLLTARGRSLEITRAGKLFILLTLAVGFAAINTGSNLLHLIFGAQMAMILASGVLSEATVRRITAIRKPAGELHARQAGLVHVDLHNADGRRDVMSVSLEDDDRVETEGSCAPVFAVRIPAGKHVRLQTTMFAPRRGRWQLPPAVVSTRFPFGLFLKRRDLGPPAEVLVYPAVGEMTEHDWHAASEGQQTSGGPMGRDGEFFGLREYRHGDALKRIHWPAVARTGRLVVREHQRLRTRALELQLPRGRTGDPEYERAIERLASVSVVAIRAGLAVSLHDGPEVAVPPGTGTAQRRRILTHLAVAGGPWPSEREIRSWA